MQTSSYSFYYNKQCYQSGTKLVYTGSCTLQFGNEKIILNNTDIVWLYSRGAFVYFSYNDKKYMCPLKDFYKGIVRVIDEKHDENTEMIWTDDMVTKTIWYIVIMLVAVIFKDRIGIWILATVIWYYSTFKNNK